MSKEKSKNKPAKQTSFLQVIDWSPEETAFLNNLPEAQYELVRREAIAKMITPIQAWNELRQTAEKVHED